MEPTFAVASLVVKPVNDLYDLIKDKITQKFDERAIKKIQKNLTERIETVQKVKTIYKGDSAINLKEFYYPTKVKIGKQIKQISYIGDISTKKNFVLQGTAGQGKSIFMRFMTSQEIRKADRIPIFFELRNLLKDETLEKAVIATLNKWLFEINENTFKVLVSSGKIILFLDGFDEVPSEHVKSVIRELEHWSELYPKLQIVISSRPDSGIEASNFFQIIPLQPYEEDDQLGLMKKLIEDEENYLQVKKALQASTLDIKDLLKTPLMVTLFVMTYRAKQIIPESLSEFYEDIFQVLMYRHDKTKPGFIRELKSKLNEKQLQEVFEVFCYLTKKEELLSFKRPKFLELLKVSLQKCNFEGENPVEVLNDITKSLCLIIQDGLEYSFIHKSIQEFFVASFIKNTTEDNSKKIYTLLGASYRDFRVELIFLKDIDKYRYLKFLYVPQIESAIQDCTSKEDFDSLAQSVFLTDDDEILYKPNRINDNEKFRLNWGEREILHIIMQSTLELSQTGLLNTSFKVLEIDINEQKTSHMRKSKLQSFEFRNKLQELVMSLNEAKKVIALKEDSSLFDLL